MRTFRNRTAWALWIFMAVWMTFLIAMTWVLVRDGPPDGHSASFMFAVFAFFWAAGLGACWYACTIRLLRVDVGEGGALEVVWRSPFRTERRRIEARDVPPAVVIDGKDSDGDPLFTCRVTLTDGTTLDLSEGAVQGEIEAVATAFNASRRSRHA